MGRRSAKKEYNPNRPPRARRVTVEEKNSLLPFLYQVLNQQSKSSVKAMLGHGQISVNGKVTTQFDTPLEPKDVVGISYERGKVAFNHPQLSVLWEDDQLIVVRKKEGLLSVANVREKERTVVHLLSSYVKKMDPRNKIFMLHRLDKDTSGVMVFAKNRGIQESFQSGWNRLVTEQVYKAVVEGRPEKESDLLHSSHALEETNLRSVVVAEDAGDEAIARYKVIKGNEMFSLLEIRLESGRHNQIRNQLGALGNPVVGDRRNGSEHNPADRLMLHASKITFVHPGTGAEMSFETQTPSTFNTLTK
ncbi:RluA family pseudouridine synthase [Parabacteroides sp. OttesenSCG-928-O15]|nr:RluA family pseudouridine synthase [Parabacteroides sp. OttesenSCG-928-O15]